jgi:hypothetical protein
MQILFSLVTIGGISALYGTSTRMKRKTTQLGNVYKYHDVAV